MAGGDSNSFPASSEAESTVWRLGTLSTSTGWLLPTVSVSCPPSSSSESLLSLLTVIMRWCSALSFFFFVFFFQRDVDHSVERSLTSSSVDKSPLSTSAVNIKNLSLLIFSCALPPPSTSTLFALAPESNRCFKSVFTSFARKTNLSLIVDFGLTRPMAGRTKYLSGALVFTRKA